MADKQIKNREIATDTVAKSAETHGAAVATGLRDRLSPHLEEGEVMPDFEFALRLVSRYMRGTFNALNLAGEAHEAELADDAQPKKDLEDARDELRKIMIDARAGVLQTFGEIGLKKLGLEGQTPRDAEGLLRLGGRVAANLTKEEIVLPEPRSNFISVDRGALATAINDVTGPVQAALDVVRREQREAETTLNAKWETLEKNDDTFGRCARWFESTYRLIGSDVIASRVRPSGRRPGQLAVEPEAPEEPQDPPTE